MKDTEGFVFGYPSEIEIDLILSGEKTMLVELKASVSKSDVYIFMKKADFYTRETGKQVDKLLMITPFIYDNARVVAKEFQIIICDSISGLEKFSLA